MKRCRSATRTFLTMTLVFCGAQLASGQTPVRTCEGLSSLSLQNTTITMAIESPAVQFWAGQLDGVPADSQTGEPETFCRVAATLRPSPDSNISVEIWLPLSGWNGKFLSAGGDLEGALGRLNWLSADALGSASWIRDGRARRRPRGPHAELRT